MSKKSYTYVPATNGRLNKDTANIVGAELRRIEAKYGAIKPDSVVKEARPSTSKLHGYFTWDNTAAADQWRTHEARELIRSVHIVVEGDEENEKEPVRAFVNVRAHDGEAKFEGNAYISSVRAFSDQAYSQQVIDLAYNELISWKERYEHLKEFSQVVLAINSIPQPA